MNTFTRVMILLLGFWLSAGSLMAGSIDKGRKAFQAGEYSKAYKLLGKAAKATKDPAEKADAYTLMGASAAKMGKSKKAKSRFVKALKLNPDVSLPSEVADDAKVKKAFAAAKKKVGTTLAAEGGSSKSSDNIRATKTKSAGADRSPGNLINYLPFGINNFMQDKTITGALLGLTQAGGLVLFFNRRQAASDADKDAEQVIADAEANNATTDPEFLQFIDDNEAFVKKSRSEANLALGIFLIGYGLSVADALFDPFGTSQKTATIEADDSRKFAKDWKVDLQVLPTSQKPLVFLDMKQQF